MIRYHLLHLRSPFVEYKVSVRPKSFYASCFSPPACFQRRSNRYQPLLPLYDESRQTSLRRVTGLPCPSSSCRTSHTFAPSVRSAGAAKGLTRSFRKRTFRCDFHYTPTLPHTRCNCFLSMSLSLSRGSGITRRRQLARPRRVAVAPPPACVSHASCGLELRSAAKCICHDNYE